MAAVNRHAGSFRDSAGLRESRTTPDCRCGSRARPKAAVMLTRDQDREPRPIVSPVNPQGTRQTRRKSSRVVLASQGEARSRWGSANRGPFRVRRAAMRDVPTIVAMVRKLAEYERLSHAVKASAARFRRDGFGPRRYFHTLLCCRRAAPVGFALYFFAYSTFAARPTLYLEDLFVLPAYRGQGAGRALLIELARIAVRKKCGRMEWTVLDWNTSAIRFYRRLGATVLKEWRLTRLAGAPLHRLARGG